jgi:Poly-beta-hydroxyalkanoate depolymerase
MADKAQRTIQWLQEVEKEDTEWGIAFDVVKNKPHSYRLLEFKRDGYPADEQALSVLIVNPNAGHDSTVGKDLVETFLKKGRRVFTLDWQSADPNAPEMVSDLISDVSECINHIEGRVEVAALCQGGWVSASAVALLASFHPDKVAATYMAAVPFYTTLGKNAITETVKTMPGWVFHMLVFYLGTARVQDGAHQMGGFENMGDVFQKQVGYWLQLAGSVDDEKELDRARGFVKWYYNKYLNLSLWYLEAVFAHFTYNDLYEGRYRTAVGNEMRTVDFSKIRVPLVLLEGTKDDVTAPGVLLKQELAALLEKDEGVEVEAAWRFLVEQHFISDTGEGNVNREPGKAAVIENKVLTTDIDVFLAIDHVFIDDTDPAILAKILAFLKEDGYGQCRALREAVGTERSQILEIIMNRGHIGVFTGNPRSEFRTRWNEAIDWVKLKIAENDKRKEEQAARNKQADEDRIMNGVQRITVGDAVSVLKQSMFRATSTHLIEQAI